MHPYTQRPRADMVDTYDVIVLGAGPAGRAAAILTRREGLSVLVADVDGFGGTCPLRGCIPKKVLTAAAETVESIKKAPAHGISTEGVHLDWRKLIDIKRSIIGKVPLETETTMRSLGITTLHGHATFTGPHSIQIEGREYRGSKIVIATGSKPRKLPITGFEHTLTSTDLFELETLPSSIIFIGGGAIGMEFSHTLTRAGCKVTILEAAPRILMSMEEDLVGRLSEYSQRLGIEIYTGVRVESIEKEPQAMAVTFSHGGRDITMRADIVANGAGRIADIEGLELGNAGVATDKKGIILDEYLRSVSNPDVLVAGDAVSSSPQLSPVATYEGRIVANNITSSDLVSPDYWAIPFCVYTIPELAGVGLTESEATERQLQFITAYHNLERLKVPTIYDEHEVYSKVLIDRNSNRIIGAHIFGRSGQELINIFALAMKHNISSYDLHKFVFVFPTFSSGIPDMVRIRRPKSESVESTQ